MALKKKQQQNCPGSPDLAARLREVILNRQIFPFLSISFILSRNHSQFFLLDSHGRAFQTKISHNINHYKCKVKYTVVRHNSIYICT